MKMKGERAIQQGSTRTPWRTSGECVSVMSPRRPLSARVCSSCCSHEGAPRRPPRQHSLSQSPCQLKRPRRSRHQPQLRLRLFQQGWPPPRPYLGRELPRSCSPRPLPRPTRRVARVPHLGGPVQQDAVLGLQRRPWNRSRSKMCCAIRRVVSTPQYGFGVGPAQGRRGRLRDRSRRASRIFRAQLCA